MWTWQKLPSNGKLYFLWTFENYKFILPRFQERLRNSDSLHDFASFIQFQKHEKRPWGSVTFSKRFLNFTNGTKSHKAPYINVNSKKTGGKTGEGLLKMAVKEPNFRKKRENTEHLQLSRVIFC